MCVKIKIIIPELPPNINKYIGRTNIWQYQKDKRNYEKLIKKTLKDKQPNFSKCNMLVTYHFPDKRKRDTHNLTKCLLDGLVEAKIIQDDNYTVLKTYTEQGVYDKNNPMVEIEIKEIKDFKVDENQISIYDYMKGE